MKTVCLLCALALTFSFAVTAAAQQQRRPTIPFVNDQTDKPLTDLELFQDTYGATLLKGFTELPRVRGTAGSVQVTVVEFRNTANNTRVKGVAVDVTTAQNEKARSFIEYAELDALIRGVTFISKVDKGMSSLQSLEAVFTTKGEFSISDFFNWQGESRVAVTAGRYEPKTVLIDQAGQTILLGQFQQAKTTLDEL
ncbi:MAG TPA: hypothetical protein VGJ02_01075 [Pyrinomonadaceae bacterium]